MVDVMAEGTTVWTVGTVIPVKVASLQKLHMLTGYCRM